MPFIEHGRGLCTVIVTVDADPEVIPQLEAHAKEGLARFQDFDGFVAGALHRSADGARLVQYLQWETEADHLTCVNDPRWEELPSARHFMSLMESGKARVDVRTFDVVSAVDAPGRENS